MSKNVGPLPVTITHEFAYAIGAAVFAWGRFEHDFNIFQLFLRERADVAALEAEIPGPFSKRVKLFRRSASLAFSDCPSLVTRLLDIMERAARYHNHRNRLAHGSIFDFSFLQNSGHLSIYIHERRAYRGYVATLPEIGAHVEDVVKMHNDFMLTFIGWGHLDVGPLTSPEKASLQNFHKTYLQAHHVPTGVPVSPPHPSFRA